MEKPHQDTQPPSELGYQNESMINIEANEYAAEEGAYHHQPLPTLVHQDPEWFGNVKGNLHNID